MENYILLINKDPTEYTSEIIAAKVSWFMKEVQGIENRDETKPEGKYRSSHTLFQTNEK